MAFEHTYTRVWSSPGSQLSKSVTVSAGGELNIDELIATAQTDKLVAFSADVSQIKGLYMVSSVDLLVQVNDGTSPTNVFSLSANVPFLWAYGDAPLRDTSGTAIATDITGLYVTNASSDTAALLQIRMLIDPTL